MLAPLIPVRESLKSRQVVAVHVLTMKMMRVVSHQGKLIRSRMIAYLNWIVY